MLIRRLQGKEILDSLHLVWEVFAKNVAPSYTPQGVAEFQKFIKLDHIMGKIQSGDLIMWGAFEGETMCGVIGMRTIGHISLFFVKNEWQRKGVGRMLFAEARRYCAEQRGVLRITVNATPQAVGAYRHLGFNESGIPQTVNGITSVSMEHRIYPSETKQVNKKKSHTGLIVGAIIVGIVLALIVAYTFIFGIIFRNAGVRTKIENRQSTEQYNEGNDIFDEGMPEEDNEGINAITCYEAEDLPYTFSDEIYTYSSRNKKGE